MRIEAKVPLIIAKEGIKLAESWRIPLITPSKPPVLEMDLLELTRLQGRPKAVDSASIDVSSIFIPSPPDLVEITEGKPLHPIWRLMRDELRKEIIFTSRGRRTVNRSKLEISMTTRVYDMHASRETKFGGNDA
jgi:hypothetical protein